MNLSTELLVGIILIGLGLLLGAAAYMVLSSRKDDKIDQETEQDEDGDHQEPPDDQDEIPEHPEEIEEELIGELEPADPVQAEGSLEPEPAVEVDIPDDTLSEQEDLEPEADSIDLAEDMPVAAQIESEDSAESEPYMPEPEPGPRIQVATLLRDEVSGELIVQVGDREYRSADELRESGDWTRVEFAASDLTHWIDQPAVRPYRERDTETETGDRTKPMSMIEQINAILQEKIEAIGDPHLAVRLIEGLEGNAKVLIGVHSYELGEVPDETISNLIREAVAEWEATS